MSRLRRLPLMASLSLLAFLTGGTAEAAVFPCEELGVRAAIAVGGGPHTFDCDGPTTIVVSSNIRITSDVVLDGEHELTLSGGGIRAVVTVEPGATVELHRLDVADGRASNATTPCCDGGGIRNGGHLTLVECGIFDNIAESSGGAIFNSAFISGGNTSLVVIDSVFAGNVARGGAAISSTAEATLAMDGSTLLSHADTTAIFHTAPIEISNSTLYSANAPAIHNSARLTLTSSTVTGAGAALTVRGALEISNTIIEGGCNEGSILIENVVTSSGGNLESPGDSCGLLDATDQVAVADLRLGPLANEGGPTLTRPLLAGSPAIGAGVDCPPPATDQRGVPRPQGLSCDSGAYEVEVEMVEIDIIPGSRRNRIRPESNRLVEVAVLGSDTLLVLDIDEGTLAFGPASAPPTVPPDPRLEDVNVDGHLDLVASYRTADTGIVRGHKEACLSGAMLDASPFAGCDMVRTSGGGSSGGLCGLGFELNLVLPLLLYQGRRRRPRR